MYGFTSEIVDHGIRFSFKEIGLLVDSTYCLFLLFVFCDCSHQASLNIARKVQVTLLKVNLGQVDPATRKEVFFSENFHSFVTVFYRLIFF